jgi:hypothetical protein
MSLKTPVRSGIAAPTRKQLSFNPQIAGRQLA